MAARSNVTLTTTVEPVRASASEQVFDPLLASPITPGGAFYFDCILKSGKVLKRKRRTDVWEPIQLCLRPAVLSLYKDEEETKLRHRIDLSDILSCTLRSEFRRHGEHEGVFSIFLSSRNYHFEAATLDEAVQWVELVKAEAGLNETRQEQTSSPEDLRQVGELRDVATGSISKPLEDEVNPFNVSGNSKVPPMSIRKGKQMRTTSRSQDDTEVSSRRLYSLSSFNKRT